MGLWLLRFVLTALALGLVLVGALLLFQPRIDLTPYRDAVNAHLSGRIGRAVQVDGGMSVRLGRRTEVFLSDVGVANPRWASSPRMLVASQASFRIDLLSLLAGVVRIEDLSLQGIAAHVAMSSSGETNWCFQPAAAETRAAGAPRLGYLIEQATVDDLTVMVEGRDGRPVIGLHLDRLEQRNRADMLVIDATGRLNDLPLAVAGEVGTLDALLAGQDVDLDLRARLHRTALSAAGHLGRPAQGEDIHLTLKLQGPDLERLLGLLDIAPAPRGDTDLVVNLIDRDRGFSWRAQGHLGPHLIDGHGVAQAPLGLRDVSVSLNLEGPTLSPLGRLLGLPTLPGRPYRLRGEVARDDRGLTFRDLEAQVGDARMTVSGVLPRFPLTRGADVALRFVGDAALFNGLFAALPESAGPIQLEASVTPDGVESERLRVDASWGQARLVLRGVLGGWPHFGGTAVDFALSGPHVRWLTAVTGEMAAAMPFSFAGRLAIDGEGTLRLEQVQGTAGPTRVAVDGSIGRLPEPNDANLALRLAGDSLRASAQAVTDIPLPALPFQVRARLLEQPLAPAIGNLVAEVGSARLEVAGKLRDLPRLTGSDAKFLAEIADLNALLPANVATRVPPGAYRISGQLLHDGQRLGLDGVEIRGAAIAIGLDASLPNMPELSGGRAQLTATGRDLSAILPARGRYRPPREPFEADLVLASTRESLGIERFALKTAGAELRGRGELVMDDGSLASRLGLAMQGPELSRLGRVEGVALPPGAFRADATLTTGGSLVALKQVHLRLGESELRGEISVTGDRRPYVDLIAEATRFDVLPFVSPLLPPALTVLPHGPEAESGSRNAAPVEPDRLIPDDPLDLPWLDALDGRFRVALTGLEYPDPASPGHRLVRDLGFDATLEEGSLEIAAFEASGDRGQLSGNGSVTRQGASLWLEGTLEGKQWRLGSPGTEGLLERLPVHHIELRFDTRGRTPREMAAALNGTLRLSGGPGQAFPAAPVEASGSFLDTLHDALGTFAAATPAIEIECTAAVLGFVGGIAQGRPGLVMRTARSDVAAVGTIDLATERLDVLAAARPRPGPVLDATADSGTWVKIAGRLAQPGLLIAEAGEPADAKAAPSFAVDRLLDRLVTSDGDCAATLARTDDALGPDSTKRP